MASASILVIEDNETHARFLAQACEERHPAAAIILARTGADAYQVLQAGLQPTLIILDLLLPDQSGYVVLEKLRCDARWPNLPVIILSTEDGEVTRHICATLGAVHYAIKPTSRSGFAEFITFLEPWLGPATTPAHD